MLDLKKKLKKEYLLRVRTSARQKMTGFLSKKLHYVNLFPQKWLSRNTLKLIS